MSSATEKSESIISEAKLQAEFIVRRLTAEVSDNIRDAVSGILQRALPKVDAPARPSEAPAAQQQTQPTQLTPAKRGKSTRKKAA